MERGYIYSITNIVTDRVYFGRARYVEKRWHTHRHYLRHDRHSNKHLQRSWNKYGENNFRFDVILDAPVSESSLNVIERIFIAIGKGADQSYNILLEGSTRFGIPHSEETKRKMSEAQKGRVLSDERRAEISKTLTGKVPSDECRAKRSAALTGRKFSDARKKCMSEKWKIISNSPTYEAFGRAQTIMEWSRESGINAMTLRNRVNRAGHPMHVALTMPNQRGCRA